MKTHDRRKDPVLCPAGGHLVILISKHMSADIMAPPSITDVGGCGCKVWLKIKGIPGNMSISGKAYRISVASGTCISGKGHGTFSVSGTVQEMEVVEDPQRIKPFDLAVASLLPVDPPEIHTFFLSRMMKIFEIGFHKFRTCRIAYYRVLIFIIHTHGLCHVLIHFFPALYTVCRMYI